MNETTTAMKNFIVAAFLVLCMCSNASNVLGFSYTMPASHKGMILKGSASFHKKYVALTEENTVEATSGRALYYQPIQFRQSKNHAATFSTHFVFQIITSDSVFPGDGMAFFISPNSTLPSTDLGGYLGLIEPDSDGNSTNHLFAVEFDTYQNSYDPDYQHVGIDVNGLASKVTSSVDFNKNSTFAAWVDYSDSSKKVEVRLATVTQGTDSSRPASPVLSLSLDLAKIVNRMMYVGFSAATGAAFEKHRLFSWNITTDM